MLSSQSPAGTQSAVVKATTAPFAFERPSAQRSGTRRVGEASMHTTEARESKENSGGPAVDASTYRICVSILMACAQTDSKQASAVARAFFDPMTTVTAVVMRAPRDDAQRPAEGYRASGAPSDPTVSRVPARYPWLAACARCPAQ